MTKRPGTATVLDPDPAAAPSTPAPAPRRASTVATLIAGNGGLVQHVPLALIDPHPDNPREQLGDLTGMVASISSPVGLMQPLTVATSRAFWAARGRGDIVDDGRYVVLAGHRRRAALELAGRAAAPCLVRDDLAGDDAVIAMLIENLHRADLEPLEEARGFTRLRELGLTQEQIAEKVGVSQPTVARRLALLRLPTDMQAQVAGHTLPVGDAVELARYADEPAEVLEQITERKSWETVDEAARRIRRDRGREQKLDAARERLRAKGAKRFTTSRPTSRRLEDYLRYGRGPMALEDLASSGVDVADHDALGCHAMFVAWNYPYTKIVTEAVCIKPKNHAGDLQAKRDKAAVRQQRASEKAAEQARKRRELARSVVDGKPSKELAELVDSLVIQQLSQGLNREAEISVLAQLLGADEHGPGVESLRTRTEILATATTPAARSRLIAALVLARCELDVDREHGNHHAAGAYLRFLQSAGHTLAGVERTHVGRIR